MKKILLYIIIYYSLYIVDGFSQPQLEWIKTYPQIGVDAVKDSSDNIIILSVGGAWFNLLKYSSNGTLIWNKTYSYSISSNLAFIATDKKSNLYITSSDPDYKYITLKIDSSGIQQWVQYYSVGVFNRPRGITLDTSGNIIVTGISQFQAYNYLTIKYNSQGDSLWTARYSGMNSASASSPNSICSDIQGNVYVTGSGSSLNTGYQWATIKYNKDGIQQWIRTYFGPWGQYGNPAYSVKIDNQRNAYVAGDARILFDLTGFGTIKYNSNGDSIWTRVYKEPNIVQASNYAKDLEIDDFGNVYVFGRGHESIINPNGAYTVVKYNSLGNILWVINDTNGHDPSKISLFGNSKIFITGNLGYKMYSAGYDSSGEKIFSSFYPPYNNANRYYTSLKTFIDKYNGLFIFGSCIDTLVLMKYLLPSNIGNISTETPSSYSLGQNYPNPFNSMCNVQFSMSNAGNAKLVVYDVMGREVQTLVNERLQPGTYEASFDGSKLNSGVYFYKLVTGNFTETKKMLLIK